MMSTAKDQLSQSEKPLQKLWENLKHQFLNSLDISILLSLIQRHSFL
jgi:hypothetical protein